MRLKQTITIALCAALFAMAAGGCNKPDEIELSTDGTVYMPQAIGTRGRLNIFTKDRPDSIVFGAAVGSFRENDQNISVQFAVDAGQIAGYNQRNGTAYRLMPPELYTLSGLTSTIRQGSFSSEPLYIILTSKRALDSIRTGAKYILPIRLTSVSNGTIDAANATSFFTLDTVLRRFTDVTGQGTLTVSNENPSGAGANEGSLKVVDNNTASKYLFFGFTANTAWMQLRFPAPVAVGAYTLTSANDASGRDPRVWRLMGSNDGTTWTMVDSRTNEAFPARNFTRRFEVPGTPQPYTHYRFFIDQNGGDGLFQLAEWRVLRYDD